jgi:hypothetical protein
MAVVSWTHIRKYRVINSGHVRLYPSLNEFSSVGQVYCTHMGLPMNRAWLFVPDPLQSQFNPSYIISLIHDQSSHSFFLWNITLQTAYMYHLPQALWCSRLNNVPRRVQRARLSFCNTLHDVPATHSFTSAVMRSRGALWISPACPVRRVDVTEVAFVPVSDTWSTTRLVPDDPEFGVAIGNLTTPVGREVVLSCTVDRLGKYKVSNTSTPTPLMPALRVES